MTKLGKDTLAAFSEIGSEDTALAADQVRLSQVMAEEVSETESRGAILTELECTYQTQDVEKFDELTAALERSKNRLNFLAGSHQVLEATISKRGSAAKEVYLKLLGRDAGDIVLGLIKRIEPMNAKLAKLYSGLAFYTRVHYAYAEERLPLDHGHHASVKLPRLNKALKLNCLNGLDTMKLRYPEFYHEIGCADTAMDNILKPEFVKNLK